MKQQIELLVKLGLTEEQAISFIKSTLIEFNDYLWHRVDTYENLMSNESVREYVDRIK